MWWDGDSGVGKDCEGQRQHLRDGEKSSTDSGQGTYLCWDRQLSLQKMGEQEDGV